MARFQATEPARLAAQAVAMSRDEREELAARLIGELLDEESSEKAQDEIR